MSDLGKLTNAACFAFSNEIYLVKTNIHQKHFFFVLDMILYRQSTVNKHTIQLQYYPDWLLWIRKRLR